MTARRAPVRRVVPATALALLAATSAAGEAAKLPLAVTNTTDRIVFCTFVFEGKSRTKLAIRPGRTWSEAFDPRRRLQLVCNRGKDNVFGPLEAGKSYELVSAGRKIDLAEPGGE
jgi:hypothetical protein